MSKYEIVTSNASQLLMVKPKIAKVSKFECAWKSKTVLGIRRLDTQPAIYTLDH